MGQDGKLLQQRPQTPIPLPPHPRRDRSQDCSHGTIHRAQEAGVRGAGGGARYREKEANMTTQELLTRLSELKGELKVRFGIEEIALFGSYARGEATQQSDVDIAILQMKENFFSKRSGVKAFLEQQLNLKIDLGYFDSMKTFIKNRIRKDMIHV